MGKGAGLEGGYFVSVPTMPVPLIKARGLPGRMIGVNPYCRAAIPGGGEWAGQALQDVAIPQGIGRWWGWVGGKCTGDNKYIRGN